MESEDEDSEAEDVVAEEDPEPSPASSEPAPARTAARPALPSITRFLMIFLFLLALYAIIDPAIGVGFAGVADAVLFPAIGFGGALPVLTILLAGLFTTLISSLIRNYYTNWVKMVRTQRTLGALGREQMEAFRKGQVTRVAKLKEVRLAYMKDSMEVQTAQMKPIAWTMLLFIVVFTWLRLFVDVTLANLGNQWIAVPWSNHVFLNSAYVFPSWVLLYSLLAIPFSMIVTRLLKYLRFRRRLDELGVPPGAGPGLEGAA